MICTLQPVSFSQQKQVDRDVRDAQGHGPSRLQTSKPSYSNAAPLAISSAGQCRAVQGRAGHHNVAPCIMEHTR